MVFVSATGMTSCRPSGRRYTLSAPETLAQRVFTPGDGATPPALAGREQEEAVLTRCLADLLGGASPPHNVALTGPRGNGKTVLLNMVQARLPRQRTGSGRGSPDSGRHPHRGSADRRSGAIVRDDEAVAPESRRGGRRLGGMGAAIRGTRNLRAELIARCGKKPLAVLLDEAHTLDVEVGRVLLNASQRVRDEAPFLLVLAGTPGLLTHLGTMNASFWSRLGEGRLGIGPLLSDAASGRAAGRPPREHRRRCPGCGGRAQPALPVLHPALGRGFVEAALGHRRGPADRRPRGRGHVAARVTDYYHDRYRELEARGLVPAALATAPLFQTGPTPPPRTRRSMTPSPGPVPTRRPGWPPART